MGVRVAFGDQEADVWWKSEVKYQPLGPRTKRAVTISAFPILGLSLCLRNRNISKIDSTFVRPNNMPGPGNIGINNFFVLKKLVIRGKRRVVQFIVRERSLRFGASGLN